MDETPVFFDMVPNKSFAKNSSKSVTIRTSSCEKKTCDSCSNQAAWGDVLPPMIILPGKTDCTIKILLLLITYVLPPRKRLGWMNV